MEKKQTPKKVKKYISASRGKSPRNTETFPARKQHASPKGENKPLNLKGQHGQEPRKPSAARSLLTGLYFELLNTFLSVNLPSAVQFCSVLYIVGLKCITAHIELCDSHSLVTHFFFSCSPEMIDLQVYSPLYNYIIIILMFFLFLSIPFTIGYTWIVFLQCTPKWQFTS